MDLLSSPGVVHAQTLGTAAVQTPDGPELITTGSFEHGLDGWQASTVSGSAFAAAGQAHGVGAQLCRAARTRSWRWWGCATALMSGWRDIRAA